MREAVGGLLEAGYLSRRHGSGTYVTSAPRSRHALDTTVSYTAMIRDAGYEPGETVLNKGVRTPTSPSASCSTCPTARASSRSSACAWPTAGR